MISLTDQIRGRNHPQHLRNLFPRPPISWPSSAMGDGYYLNTFVGDSIHDLERKPEEQITASVMNKQRPTFRRFRDRFNPMIEFGKKRVRCGLTFFRIPQPSSRGFFYRLRMEDNGKTGHQRPRIFRRASLQETTRAGAESRSFNRRAISRSHSASASSSTAVSRLSSNEPAIAARASGGSFSAASSNFVASDPMSEY